MTPRRLAGWLILLAAVTLLVLACMAAFDRLSLRPRTNDAYLDADIIHMAPDVSGRIISIAVANNQLVRRGDVLFTIDPEPFQLRLEQAEADVRGLAGKLDVTTDSVASQTAKADAADSAITSARAQLALASSTLARLEPLLARGFVPAQQVDQARTAQRTAQISLQQALQQAEEARKAISSVKPVEQELLAARAAADLARRDLRLSVVRSPCDGRVTGLDVAAGEFAAAGRPVFTLIDTEHWWAVGNFREGQLDGIRPGQRARVWLLSAGGRPIDGTVESLGWGVSPDEGIELAGLPRVPRSLSWVRIAQRFPVRVRLDQPPPELMRIGASAAMMVETSP